MTAGQKSECEKEPEMQGSWEISQKDGRKGPKGLEEEQPEGMANFPKASSDHSIPYLLDPCYKVFLNIRIENCVMHNCMSIT